MLKAGPGEWNRVRHAEAAETPRYRVADAVVTEATKRTADLPDGVGETDVVRLIPAPTNAEPSDR